jgi:hypothetical protein
MDSEPINFSSFENPFAAEVATSLDSADSLNHLREEFLIPSKSNLKKPTLSQIRK